MQRKCGRDENNGSFGFKLPTQKRRSDTFRTTLLFLSALSIRAELLMKVSQQHLTPHSFIQDGGDSNSDVANAHFGILNAERVC